MSTKDAEIKKRVLNKLENEPNLTSQNLAEDCQRFMNVWQDAKNIDVVRHIKKVSQQNKVKKKYYSKVLLRKWRTTFL